MSLAEKVKDVLSSLEDYIDKEEFKGWDPFDGLNSPLSNFLTWRKRIPSMVWLQLLKHLPINLRPVLAISKVHNPKGIALFLEAFILKHQLRNDEESLEKARGLANWLIHDSRSGYSGACWGYPFDWANRIFYAAKGTPNIVVTVFCAEALLNFYRLTKEDQYFRVAKSGCDFIIHDLFKTERGNTFCFSYTPLDKTCVHNANMLAASLLGKVSRMTGEEIYKDYALKSMNFSIESQRKDGSWLYGESQIQKWIDSFHTGYNLTALSSYIKETGDNAWKEALLRGYEFFKSNFVLPNGAVKYYHDKIYPFDAHAFAEAIICLCELSYVEDNRMLIDNIVRKLLTEFWSERGYFFYLKRPYWTIKIPYMRWVQAWVFYALWRYLWTFKRREESF